MNAEELTVEEIQALNRRASNTLRRANDKQVAGTHYKDMGVQVWDVVDSWPQSERIGYYRGNALKYVMRMGTKDASVQEIKKAIHYLEKLVEILEDKNG